MILYRRTVTILACLTVTMLAGCTNGPIQTHHTFSPAQTNNPGWQTGQAQVIWRHNLPAYGTKAKNVILFIGDGMGIATITASRIYDGQQKGLKGEENTLPFEEFPQVALVKTYNSNQQVPDSAGTASAINTGVKTKAGVIGLSAEALRNTCSDTGPYTVTTLAELAEDAGLSTGIVTTATLTHATPAAVYAHVSERGWEYDAAIPEAVRAEGCLDIARQFVDFHYGNGIDVAFGGGKAHFMGAGAGGKRLTSDENLIKNWLKKSPHRRYVDSKAAFDQVMAEDGVQVLGLFNNSHLTFERLKTAETDEPSLSEMTAKAIDILSRNPKGYYLMVEGGRIDHANHIGVAELALTEAQEFARTVAIALQKVDLSETLILVTADHSSVMTIGGYPTRGNPILGLVVENDEHGVPDAEPAQDRDGKTYTTLGYYNGPGAVSGDRKDMTATAASDELFQQQALIPTGSEDITGHMTVSATHGGEDVALFAIGPSSQFVGGVIEQNVIFHIISHALGWRFQR